MNSSVRFALVCAFGLVLAACSGSKTQPVDAGPGCTGTVCSGVCVNIKSDNAMRLMWERLSGGDRV